MFTAALWHFNRGEYEKVRTLLEPLTKRAGPLTLLLGRAYLRLGQMPEAIAELTKAAAQLPDRWEPPYYSGCACGRSGDMAAAKLHFEEALARHPPLPHLVCVQRGHAHLRSGDLAAAGADYETAEKLQAGPSVGIAYECLGLRFADRSDYAEAHRWLSRAFRLGREGDNVLAVLGWCCYRLGRADECLRHWLELAKRHPGDPNLEMRIRAARRRAGIEAAYAGDWRAAIAAWQDCPGANLGEAHFRAAAQLLREGGDRAQPQARRHLLAARELQPDQPRASYYLALLDIQAGSPDSALELLTVPEPRNAYARGLILCHKGDQTAARAAWQQLLASSGEWVEKARLSIAAMCAGERRWGDAFHWLRQDDGNPASGLRAACLWFAGRTAELQRLTSRDGQTAYYQALGLMAANRRDEALALLSETAGNDAPKAARELLADLRSEKVPDLVRAGRYAEAASTLQTVFDLDAHRREKLELGSRIVQATAALYLLASARPAAARLAGTWLSCHLDDARAAHFVMVGRYWEALRLFRSADDPSLPWREAVAGAVLLLENEQFWDDWPNQREKIYGTPVPSETVAAVRQRLEKHLRERFPVTSELWIEFQVEIGGARALRQLGGLPLPERHDRVACGPTMARMANRLGDLAAFLREQLDRESRRSAATSLLGAMLGDGHPAPHVSRSGAPQATFDARLRPRSRLRHCRQYPSSRRR